MDIPKLLVTEKGIVMDGYPIYRPFFSLWSLYPHLKGRTLVIGLIGGRGSGKSTGAARVLVLDYLLKGKNVWSNMQVAVDWCLDNKCCMLRSNPIESGLDIKQCSNGVIFLDEINQGYADSWRSQTTESLEFAYEAQQLRKSKLDLIWTTQSETFTNPRLRFQTDIIIKCADLSLTNKKVGVGEFSRWEIWDYSGIVTGKLETVRLPEAPLIFNKPWWHVFDTTQKQTVESTGDPTKALYELAPVIADYIKREEDRVPMQNVWAKWRLWDRKDQSVIRRILASDYAITWDSHNRYFQYDEELLPV